MVPISFALLLSQHGDAGPSDLITYTIIVYLEPCALAKSNDFGALADVLKKHGARE